MAENIIKVDIISGFLGAGKTTIIKKLVSEAIKGENVVIIENEFGEIGVDGDFLKDAGIEIKEMNSGCICCSLVGDFGKALKEMIEKYSPERIIIEPSGVGKLSDVIKSVKDLELDNVVINSATAIVDAGKAKMYHKNFGEFFDNQIQSAGTVVLSRTQNVNDTKVMDSAELVNELNPRASIVTSAWTELDAEKLLETMESSSKLLDVILDEMEHPDRHYHDHGDGNYHFHGDEEEHDPEHQHEHEHHHDHEHEHHHHHEHSHGDETHDHGHEHKHEHEHDHHHEHEHDHEHGEGHDHGHCCCDGDHDDHVHAESELGDHDHHHHHDDECGCGHEDHHHEHDHGDSCGCGCGHDHGDGHHHHDADEVFESWGVETEISIEKDELDKVLDKLANESGYGVIVRAKGIVHDAAGNWYNFDLTPGEYEIRDAKADDICKLVVIGSELKRNEIKEIFKLK
ncbi:MAG: GTP-binding protein [Clostridiales bacterium]|nr:GTP-binding protein [Clostridiales bacterium]MDU1042043.1 GTP-binding protein [Clostridiales bacterium]MDU3490671.1 GTP-binding protein [Clostridiales bacterium]